MVEKRKNSIRGRSALLASQFQPDLILCDIHMPDMEGGDVFREVKEDRSTKDIPFLFLSSLVSPDLVAQRGGVVGGKPMISKKTPFADIVARLERELGI